MALAEPPSEEKDAYTQKSGHCDAWHYTVHGPICVQMES